MRQAVHLVERIDWDESCTPLEAVVREQELILEHKPPCNFQGSRPENYTYLKVSDTGSGLSLALTTRQPRWIAAGDPGTRPARAPLIVGPFRGRTRMVQALDLLHRCYPIRRCPRGAVTRPCVRLECGDCLAPCGGEPHTLEQHDTLVMGIVDWLAGRSTEGFEDPTERAEHLLHSLSRQRRYEEAQRVREARDHLVGVRRSYQSLTEAVCLRFAALWPTVDEDGSAALRVNLVWDGRLREAVTLPSERVVQRLRDHLDALWAARPAVRGPRAPMPVVAQKDLDALLAIRRWCNEGVTSVVILPGADAGLEERERATARLLDEAWQVLAVWPADQAAGAAF